MRRASAHLRAVEGRKDHTIGPIALHAPNGRVFLGVRVRRNGSFEIILDQLGVRRSIWEVVHGTVGLDVLQDACHHAIKADNCLSTLHATLSQGGIRIACKEDRFGDSL
jgi:hypothetical protein